MLGVSGLNIWSKDETIVKRLVARPPLFSWSFIFFWGRLVTWVVSQISGNSECDSVTRVVVVNIYLSVKFITNVMQQ